MTQRNESRNKARPSADEDIKIVPSDAGVRERIRAHAERAAGDIDRSRPIKRDELEQLTRSLLNELELPIDYLGFAMVALSNEFWRPQFAAIRFNRRILLLPHCLRKLDVCQGTYTSLGLDCVSCGACPIGKLKAEAEAIGYQVIIAEGTPAVVQVVLSGDADGILGVACLDSLEKAFERVVDLGIPHMAVPLLVDGCVETTAELNQVYAMLRMSSAPVSERTRSYVPLLRYAERLFEPGILDALLAEELRLAKASTHDAREDPMHGAEIIARDWLRAGGKRFRPFVTLASYAAMTLGEAALHPDADLTEAFPEVVQRTAVAVEAIHKASLVHDDIEDEDAYRYGRQTLHRRWGMPTAINVGDYLVGLGYRLIASGADELGADAAADMLGMFSTSHLRLSRGQGAEILMRENDMRALRPIDLLSIYALKTAPAFEAAICVGLRAAGAVDAWRERLRAYARYLGIAYQVLNDLKDWNTDDDKLLAGQDLLSMRPTVLQAFAFEAVDRASGEELLGLMQSDVAEEAKLARMRQIYCTRGVFQRAEALVEKYRKRAVAAATGIEPPALRELMHFIVDVVLR